MFALSSATRTPLTILALTSLSIGWSQPSDDRPGISLEARTLTDTLLAGQPLRVFLSVAVGDAGFEGAFALRPEMGRSGFIIEGPGGQVRLSSRDLRDPMVAPGDWLPPNRPNSYGRGFTESTCGYSMASSVHSSSLAPQENIACGGGLPCFRGMT